MSIEGNRSWFKPETIIWFITVVFLAGGYFFAFASKTDLEKVADELIKSRQAQFDRHEQTQSEQRKELLERLTTLEAKIDDLNKYLRNHNRR